MPRSPNDFLESTKIKILKRAGYMCSKPGCNINLVGPHTDPEGQGVVNIGEVSHIKGARPAPNNRYDPSMTPAQTSHHTNGIALCRTHAKLIDSDEIRFAVEILRKWKAAHEQLVPLMQSGDFSGQEDEYYEKPYSKCSSDELRTDREYRSGLIKNVDRKNNGIFVKLSAAAIVFISISAILMWMYDVSWDFFPLIVVLAGLIFLRLFTELASKDSDFVQRQMASIREVDILLKERGEE